MLCAVIRAVAMMSVSGHYDPIAEALARHSEQSYADPIHCVRHDGMFRCCQNAPDMVWILFESPQI